MNINLTSNFQILILLNYKLLFVFSYLKIKNKNYLREVEIYHWKLFLLVAILFTHKYARCS